MKKLIITLIACLFAVVPVFSQNRTTRSNLNLRASSNTESTILDVIPKGAQVYVVDNLTTGWSHVIYNHQIGYVCTSYLLSENNHDPKPRPAVRYYTNSYGQRVQSPTHYSSTPRCPTARCADGSYSFSHNRRGTCSHHGGVAQWL